MSTKRNKMNENPKVTPQDFETAPALTADEQAFNDLCLFSQSIDHHELKEELWEQLFYTLTADDSLMTGNQRAAHMMNYKLMLGVSKAIRQLFPHNNETRVKIKVKAEV